MKKGQESMPIELLLGVTILSFVIAIGFYSYRQVCVTQYNQKVESNLNNLARTMEQTYQGGIGTSPPAITVDTSPPPGCDVGFKSVNLLRGPETACQSHLNRDYCIMAVAIGVDDRGNNYVISRVYIDIPEGVTIEWEQDCELLELEKILRDEEEAECEWGRGVFSLKLTKEDRTTISIEELGG